MCSACELVPAGARGELGVLILDAGARGRGDNTASSLPTRAPIDALSAHIKDTAGLQLEILTVKCAGDCVDLVAHASGGNPPYTYLWEDSSSAPTRRVCPEPGEQIALRVTDTAIAAPELGYDAQMAMATLTAALARCPLLDAGGETDMTRDAGPVQPEQSSCVQRPISASAAMSCTKLGPARDCYAGPREPLSRVYDLPFQLDPGGAGCLIALGNTRDLDSALSFIVSGEEADCDLSGEVLHDPLVNPASFNEAGQAQVICLGVPSRAYTKLGITLSSFTGEFGDLELRMCERCPL